MSLATDVRFNHLEIVGVLTREDAPVGRKRVMTPSPVALAATELGLTVIKANKLDGAALAAVHETGAAIGIVVAYGVLLKREALETLDRGWFNLHFSVLPKWRGAAPVQRAIMAGESTTGVTLFKLDEGMDTGPVVGFVEAEIQPEETAGELLNRCRLLGESLLAEALPALEAGIAKLTPQNSSEATLAPKLSRQDAQLRASSTVGEADCLVRGTNPEPIAWCALGDGQLRVLRARPMNAGLAAPSELGTISLREGRVSLALADGLLELVEVQPAGKNAMKAVDWARGAKLPIRIESD